MCVCVCVYTCKKLLCTLVKDPVVQVKSLVDYTNIKITGRAPKTCKVCESLVDYRNIKITRHALKTCEAQ